MPNETPPSDLLVTLTSDIAAAYAGNNIIAAEEVGTLIEAIYGALASLGSTVEVSIPAPEPAVSIRSSVKPDSVTCLECGRKMKMLKRHLSTEHGLSTDDYRARWNLGLDYPLVAPNYAGRRRELAKKIGLGRKPGQKIIRKRA